jgi:hypothetical protein
MLTGGANCSCPTPIGKQQITEPPAGGHSCRHLHTQPAVIPFSHLHSVNKADMQATHQHLGLVTQARHESNTSAGQGFQQAQQHMCCWLWPATADYTHHTAFSTHCLQQVQSCKNKVRMGRPPSARPGQCMQTNAVSGPQVQRTTAAAAAVCLCQPTRPLKPAELTTRLQKGTAHGAALLRDLSLVMTCRHQCLLQDCHGHPLDQLRLDTAQTSTAAMHTAGQGMMIIAGFWSISANLTQHMQWQRAVAHIPHMAPAYHRRSTRLHHRCTAPFHRRCGLLLEGRTSTCG